MLGLYLAARSDRHLDFNIIYNDIDTRFNCDITCDMLAVNLDDYDFLIATPPCNYYSRCNYRREVSSYALSTKHLLPCIIEKFALTHKPFIIENVRNEKLFLKEGIFNICDKYNINVYFLGRHTYFTNVFINLYCKQEFDFYNHGIRRHPNIQGGNNVHNVIEIWLKYLFETVFMV